MPQPCWGRPCPRWETTVGRAGAVPLEMIDVDPDRPDVPVGDVSAAGGNYAFLAVKAGVDLALAGRVDAIVTAPLKQGGPEQGRARLMPAIPTCWRT